MKKLWVILGIIVMLGMNVATAQDTPIPTEELPIVENVTPQSEYKKADLNALEKGLDQLKDSCWICPIYDSIYHIMAKISFEFYDFIRLPLLHMIALLFVIYWCINILSQLWNGKFTADGWVTKTLLPRGIALMIATLLLTTSPSDKNHPLRWATEVMFQPVAHLTIGISQTMMQTNKTCTYKGWDIDEEKSLMPQKLKDEIMCMIEQVFTFMMRIILLGWLLMVAGLSKMSLMGIFGGGIIAYLFTKNFFKLSFYLLDPVYEIGMAFILFPLVLARWVLDGFESLTKVIDDSAKLPSFMDLFYRFINACIVLVFTTIVLSFVVAIILNLIMPNVDMAKIDMALLDMRLGELVNEFNFEKSDLWALIIGGFMCRMLIDMIKKLISDFGGVRVTHDVQEAADKMVKDLKKKLTFNKTQKEQWKKFQKTQVYDRVWENGVKKAWGNQTTKLKKNLNPRKWGK